MNILIMDDDEYTVETIKAMIDWEAIGVDNVFSATTVFSAKQIFEAAQLDIMLCDIEMHDETGLDFVEHGGGDISDQLCGVFLCAEGASAPEPRICVKAGEV